MRVVVIGLITEDVLTALSDDHASASIYRGLGGVLHSAIALAGHGVETAVISPAAPGVAEQVRRTYGHLPGLDLTHVCGDRRGMPRCYLFWSPESSEPVEQTVTDGVPISAAEIRRCLRGPQFDLLYVNFTVGHDVELATVEALSEAGYHVYLDWHMAMYRRDPAGSRYLSPPPDWRRWLASADVVQLNEVEMIALKSLAGLPAGEEDDQVEGFMLSLPRGGRRPAAIIVTSAREIVVGICGVSGNVVEKIPVDRVEGVSPLHAVGCGDVFGAGVVSCCLESWTRANLASGIRRGAQWARAALGAIGVSLPPSSSAVRPAL